MGMNGGTDKTTTPTKRIPHRTWFDIMNEVRDPRKRNKEVIPNSGRNADDE